MPRPQPDLGESNLWECSQVPMLFKASLVTSGRSNIMNHYFVFFFFLNFIFFFIILRVKCLGFLACKSNANLQLIGKASSWDSFNLGYIQTQNVKTNLKPDAIIYEHSKN